MAKNEVMLRICHLLNQCDGCEKKIAYRNRMSVKDLEKLCEGCQVYGELKEIRPHIDHESRKRKTKKVSK